MRNFTGMGWLVMMVSVVGMVIGSGCAKKSEQESAVLIASDESVPYDYHEDDYDKEDVDKRFGAETIAAAEAKAAMFPNQVAEINQEAERWLKTFDINDIGHVIGNAYNPLDGVYFSFKEIKERNTEAETVSGYDSYTWIATSKAKIGDCPAGSAWRICVSIDCDWSAFRCGLESVKEECRFIQIAPKAIRQPKDFFKTQSNEEPR